MIMIGIMAILLIAAVAIILAIISSHRTMDNQMTRTTPRDFFMHLGVMVTLYIAVGALLVLLFQVINFAFPDALDYGYYYGAYNPYSGPVRWSIAALVVVFPLLWFLSGVLRKDYVAEPEKRNVALRKWLVYLTLFIAGVTIMIDLIVLINTFLGGEITVRFILKALSVLAVTGLVFGYFTYDLRHDLPSSTKASRMFLAAAAALIGASIVGGFFVMGSPSKQRDMEFDSRRVSDLQGVQWQIVNYWQRKGELPVTLDALNDPISSYMVPVDPETGEAYEYDKAGDLSFKLCADFKYESEAVRRGMNFERMPSPSYPAGGNEIWEHPAGEYCFDRTIDPELYPKLDASGRPIAKPVPATTMQAS